MKKEVNVSYEEFTSGVLNKTLTAAVDLNKGHALMKTSFAPSEWRFGIKLMTFVTLLIFPASLILLFFAKWYIPLIMVFTGFIFVKAIRQTAAEAVIETSIKDSEFYNHAILSETMKVYTKEN